MHGQFMSRYCTLPCGSNSLVPYWRCSKGSPSFGFTRVHMLEEGTFLHVLHNTTPLWCAERTFPKRGRIAELQAQESATSIRKHEKSTLAVGKGGNLH